ncbi:acyl carrier protein [Geothermobacter hydrogeniphilus]|uniref:Acyl carrier protein n=1 Tax=Geothermobacter hydrogeniphilus TaxID=1969733 RepID=A0A2K2HBH5_9BACT|nr:phosphopantetheine-binding protein [Geothermobacter hydrogeniphilus]PNU20645.1 acyl carrier protein [Geothermobacter hydrogeniphilus]
MTDQEVIALINRTLCEEFELDPETMHPGVTLYDELELDSLDAVDMVVALEQAFQIRIREEERMRQIRTLGEIHAYVLEKYHALAS